MSGLEVITDEEDVLSGTQFEETIDQSVLGRSVDEGDTFKAAGGGVDDGGRDFGVGLFNTLEEVVSSVVDSGSDLAVSLGVGSPHNNDLVDLVVFLELSELGSDGFKMFLLVVSGEDVVSSVSLVVSNEVGVVDSGEGDHILHVFTDLLLEIVFEDFSSSHGILHVGFGDIPTANNDFVGVDDGEELVQGDKDFLVLALADLGTRALGDGSKEVGLVSTGLGVPGDVVLVGKETSGEGGTVVTTETDEHDTELRGSKISLEAVSVLLQGAGVDTIAFFDVVGVVLIGRDQFVSFNLGEGTDDFRLVDFHF